jgi:hypothetical protein
MRYSIFDLPNKLEIGDIVTEPTETGEVCWVCVDKISNYNYMIYHMKTDDVYDTSSINGRIVI